ncbi:MAG: hypothetical protein ACFFBP_07040 [Promethearchaeota archaeon]
MTLKARTIEIDDSGTGDIVGDAFIGFHVIESGEIIFRGIPVGLYNEENHKNRKSFEYILEMVKDGLKALNFNKEHDVIQICRGSCFNKVREWFDENGIKHEPAIVEGKLQEAVEGRFVAHLRKLGVKSSKVTMEAGFDRYFALFDWITRDFPSREKHVKTGFPSWKKKWRIIAENRFKKRHNKNFIRKKTLKKKVNQRAEEILKTM